MPSTAFTCFPVADSWVVLDPYSGEIKASASFPAYTLQTLGTDVADEENTPMINRAFLPYAVGSTFKIVTAAAALEAGIPLSESMVCEGYLDVSGQIFRCHNLSGHGEVDLLDGMMESCNPYFIHLAQLTGGAALLETARRFGFGEGLTLAPGIVVSGGSLPGEAEMKNPAAVANLSFGQGVLTASPVQIARMTAAVVNGGYLVTPKLVLGTTADGKTLSRESAVPDQQILSPDIAAQIQALLIHCVMVKEGQNALPSLTLAGPVRELHKVATAYCS